MHKFAFRKVVFHRRGEVKKTQCQCTVAITDFHGEHFAFAKQGIHCHHFALYRGP
ncbi:Uncharacterised protein [Vibrio cholerae]|nr:Uncharacterised protein [Vibrio cholerae]CSI48730.1 Uncharacterised protein [Vibrio cholerae]